MLSHLPDDIKNEKLNYLRSKGFQALKFPGAATVRVIGNKKFKWDLLESMDKEGNVIYATSPQYITDAVKKLQKYGMDYEVKNI